MQWIFLGLLLVACVGIGYFYKGSSCEEEKARITLDGLRSGIKAAHEASEDREEIENRTKTYDEKRIDSDLVDSGWVRAY